MWLVLQNRSICIKREPPCVRGLFWPKGRTRTLLFPVIAWKLPLLLTFARGSKNCPQNSSICLKTGTPYVYSLFLAKRNDGDPSLSRNCVETSSLTHFCTRIHELWLVLWSSSICPKTMGPPCAPDMYCLKWKNGDSSPSRKRMETSTLTHHCVRIHEMWLVLRNPFICIKTEPPCVSLSCFGQKEGWRVFYSLELDGNFRSCSFLHEDS